MAYQVIDIETTGLDPFTDKINLVGIKDLASGKKDYFIRDFQKHEKALGFYASRYSFHPLEDFAKHYRNLKDEDAKFIFQNGKFDTNFISYHLKFNIPVDHDVLYLLYLTSSVHELVTNKNSGYLTLKNAAQRILGVEDWDVGMSDKTDINIKTIEYLGNDLDYTGQLFEKLYAMLDGKDKITYSIMIKATKAFADMELNGIAFNIDKASELLKRLSKSYDLVQQELYEMFPKVNFGSSSQIAHLLFEQLDLPVIRYTDKGNPSTDVETLVELKGQHDVIDHILAIRDLKKQITFIEDWIARSWGGRLYPSFHLTNTVTGRTSSSKPNIQQVPRNKEIKGLFDGGDGYTLVQIDYSQMELRMVATVADIEDMKRAYANGEDVHTNMAKEILDKKHVTKAERSVAKPVNFGFIYGMGARAFPSFAKVSYGMDFSLDQAVEMREAFFSRYPELPIWYKQVENELMHNGFVDTYLGRRYYVGVEPLLQKDLRQQYVRRAINAKVQSPASDYALLGLITVHGFLKTIEPDVKLVAAVHDSIILEVPDSIDLVSHLEKLKDLMEHPKYLSGILKYLNKPEIPVPIVADVEIGPWGNGEDLSKFESEELPF